MADYPNDTGLVDAVGNMMPEARAMRTPQAPVQTDEIFLLIFRQ